MTCRGAAEDIISESWGFLNECHTHPESLEKHLGAARELSEISWGSLQHLLSIFGRSFASSWDSLGDFKVFPGCLLEVIGCLGGENHPNLDARQCQKPTQAGDSVLSQNVAKHMYFFGSGRLF